MSLRVREREREREREKERGNVTLTRHAPSNREREEECVSFSSTCVCVHLSARVGVLTFFMGCILYSAKNDKLLLFFFSSVFKKVIFRFEHRHQSIFHRSSLVSKPTVVEIVVG